MPRSASATPSGSPLGGQVQHKSGGGGIAAQCRGVLLRRYPAPVEQNDAVAVGVQSGGRASCRDDCASRADFPDEAVQSGALGGVQSFCGVIQQEEFRFSQQCLCQRDASADDIRQGAYAFILHVRDGGLPAHGGYLPDRVLSPQAFCPCDKVQVLPDGHIGGRLHALRQISDLFFCLAWLSDDVISADLHGAPVRSYASCHHFQQGCFACSGRSYECAEVACFGAVPYAECDVPEDLLSRAASAEILNFDQGVLSPSASSVFGASSMLYGFCSLSYRSAVCGT